MKKQLSVQPSFKRAHVFLINKKIGEFWNTRRWEKYGKLQNGNIYTIEICSTEGLVIQNTKDLSLEYGVKISVPRF